MNTLAPMACLLAGLAVMGNAQSDEPFKGKIYNLDPEPAPNIPPDPPKAAEQAAKPAPVAAVIPAPTEQPPATQASATQSLAPAVRPHEYTTAAPSYTQPAPVPPTHKMTRREKWVRAAQIITAISAGATVAVRCQQVRQKPLIRYTGADYQNLQWCAANGF